MSNPIEPVRAEATRHDLDRALLGALSWFAEARAARTAPVTRGFDRDPALLAVLGLVSLFAHVERRLPNPETRPAPSQADGGPTARREWLR